MSPLFVLCSELAAEVLQLPGLIRKSEGGAVEEG